MNHVDIANTIARQIPMMDKMAIGYRRPRSMDETGERSGGLNFKVNTQPQRFCDIELLWNDTYRVTYFRIKRGSLDRITLATADQVYADCLGTTLYNMTQATDQYNAQA